MIPLFLGITAANLLILAAVFALGWAAAGWHASVQLHTYHVVAGVVGGLMATLTHSVVYTYFMATSKWLAAATDKAGLDAARFIEPPRQLKKKVLFIMLAAVGITMLTMFGGAATDTIAWWPRGVHLVMGCATILVNGVCAVLEYRAIMAQGKTMGLALAILNRARTANA